jgi:cyclopropane fatty-acyl-phospholipid synthase-like methyltransferase
LARADTLAFMSLPRGTPDWLKTKVRDYFQGTTEASYLANWSGKALSFHFGLSDESTNSLDEAHINANAALADHAGIARGMRVLDAGCGVGGTSIWLAKERGAKVVGLTLDPRQAELARGFAKERGVAELTEFHVMDYAATTFAPASFDVVINLESLCHCMDARAYFAHVATLLVPGGRYACMEFFRGSADEELLETVMEGWAMPYWQSMPEIEDSLKAAGFAEVKSIDISAKAIRSAQQMKAMASNSLMLVKLARASGAPEGSPIYEGHVRAAIAAADGIIAGGIPYGMISGLRY